METSKAYFMERLGQTLVAANIGVDHIVYDDSYVTVFFENGCSKKACIECDSRLAIIRDVTKILG